MWLPEKKESHEVEKKFYNLGARPETKTSFPYFMVYSFHAFLSRKKERKKERKRERKKEKHYYLRFNKGIITNLPRRKFQTRFVLAVYIWNADIFSDGDASYK